MNPIGIDCQGAFVVILARLLKSIEAGKAVFESQTGLTRPEGKNASSRDPGRGMAEPNNFL